jgi:hypothetical protein
MPRLLAAALPQVWPLISLFWRWRRKEKKREGDSWWNKIAEPLAAVVGWLDQGIDQDQPRPPRRFES